MNPIHSENFQPLFISTPYNLQDNNVLSNSRSGQESLNTSNGAPQHPSDTSLSYQSPLQTPNSFAASPQSYSGQNTEGSNSNVYCAPQAIHSNQQHNNRLDYNTQQVLQLSQPNSFSNANHVIFAYQNNQSPNQYGISMQLSQKVIQNRVQSVHLNNFFYQPSNDLLNYHIKYEKISLQLLNSSTPLKENELTFYHQQRSNNQFYQITCKIVSPNYLNKMLYGVEIDQNMGQERLAFTFDQKENLKRHLIQYLSRHLLD